MAVLLVFFCALVIFCLIKFLMMLRPPDFISVTALRKTSLGENRTALTNNHPISINVIQVSHHDPKGNSPSNLSQHSSKIACPRLKYSRRVKIEKTDKYTQVNQYMLKELIGQGSYGMVQLAYNKSDDLHYAMKIVSKKKIMKKSGFFGRLAPRRNNTASASHPLDRINREINILKKLDHPNIVKLVEVLDDPVQDNLYLAFELLDLGPVVLDAPNENPMEEIQARIYFRDLLLGIEYLHHNHVVHRDIKPANLLLGSDKKLRIADFGVSSEFHGADDIVLETTAGTPAFHAPEELGVGKFHGKAADIWAMGITLYFFVYGVLPFNDTNIFALHKLIQQEELRFPDENSISTKLKDLLVRMLCKDPNQRITIPEIKKHPWVTCEGTWLFEEKVDSCSSVERLIDDIVVDECSLSPVTSILSIAYFSSLTHLVKSLFLKHSFQLPFRDN
uniref:calcium/calmodulin-dependent protein kinase n=1 Tax=Daphnia galeata TaxID=27404 RepID=A0A8J2RB89_9CRUS|nr:unnamed protein product [Daphnia galeata]